MFIPLGGSRGSRWQTYRNLMITMTLGGLWHGAAWSYVVWGIAHGTLLIVHRQFKAFCDTRPRLDEALQTTLGTGFRILLTFFAVAALACGHAALRPEARRPLLLWLGFYALSAFGVLTKGPVGLLVPGLVLLAYGLANRRRVRGGGWAHAAGAALFVAIVCAWLVPATIAGGKEYAQEIGLDQTLKRVAKSTSHAQPFYYYLMWYPAAFFPWSFVFPLALVAAVREWRRSREPGAQLVVLWFAVIFLFFSAISGKRLGYLMPIVPAIGLGIGWYAVQSLRGGVPWPRWHTWLSGITLGVFALPGR